MKLYEVPRNTVIKIGDSEPFYFHHIDGMYSLCSPTKESEDYFHIAAWTEVELIDETSNQ